MAQYSGTSYGVLSFGNVPYKYDIIIIIIIVIVIVVIIIIIRVNTPLLIQYSQLQSKFTR